mmetsp:Transcript_3056/g.4141  ORF Transcript_3056/g.4141 Transcript_3056/m.4141 type:complete len:372 (-) Transcript_3056:83-1198(-)|eukprot:CAMPEP_0185734036 /NCGR_PEP_ID=MMETSP1171-20130828/21211_1 /TAXON_ID=374046 /ORGANISM="Helicotheca tamensis, Strain CCMP826" /LENGTH=371 /DNA_ID=CAMNT_0028403923 /DNA_START=30 /DNA_END=1145 /DNA_ORIENTATION=-
MTDVVKAVVAAPEQALNNDRGTDTGIYEPLQHTQFDSVIRFLQSQKIMPGACIIKGEGGGYPKGSDGWLATVLIIDGRNLDSILWPWLIVTLNAIFWTTLVTTDAVGPYTEGAPSMNFSRVYSYGLTTTLSMLVSFRLNRSILRYWSGMGAWGKIVGNTRSLVSSVLVHGRDIPYHRDQIIAWAAALAVAAKKEIRDFEIVCDDLQDVLTDDQIEALNLAPNSALYAANEIRHNLKPLFDVRPDYNHSALAPARSGEMRQHEKFLDAILHNVGVVHNLKSTPLPLVYVAHVRSFLVFYLLSLPYMTVYLWDWATIPIVSITAWLLLGVEAASSEVESPFEKGKVNDLDLDNYCLAIMLDIKQLVKDFNESK